MPKRLTNIAAFMVGDVKKDGVACRVFRTSYEAEQIMAELNQPHTGVVADMESHSLRHAVGCTDMAYARCYTLRALPAPVVAAPAEPAPVARTTDVLIFESPEGVFTCLKCGANVPARKAAANRCPNGCKGGV